MDYATLVHYATLIMATLSPLFAAAAVYSEKLALDPTTQANGIIQGRRLARVALAIIPEAVKDIQDKNFSAAPQIIADAVKAYDTPDPAPAATAAADPAAQTTINALRAQLAEAGITPTA